MKDTQNPGPELITTMIAWRDHVASCGRCAYYRCDTGLRLWQAMQADEEALRTPYAVRLRSGWTVGLWDLRRAGRLVQISPGAELIDQTHLFTIERAGA